MTAAVLSLGRLAIEERLEYATLRMHQGIRGCKSGYYAITGEGDGFVLGWRCDAKGYRIGNDDHLIHASAIETRTAMRMNLTTGELE